MLFGGCSIAAGATSLTKEATIEVLKVNPSDASTTVADWNGKRTVFVDFPDPPNRVEDRQAMAIPRDDQERQLFAVQAIAGPESSAVHVTTGEHEGGLPDVAAIGFANADRDAAKELIVILTWNTKHYDVEGTFYEVRLFDDLKPGQAELTSLESLSKHLGSECDCYWRDGTEKHFRFKTIAAVKRELRRLGF